MLQGLERKWVDARANQNRRYQATSEILRGVFAEQTADLLSDLTENDGCKAVKLSWLESGDHEVDDEENLPAYAKTTVTCDIDGPLAASSAAEYFMDDRLKVRLRVNAQECGNYFTFDDKFQHMMLSKQIDLINKLARKVLRFMAASSGVSVTPGQLGAYQGAGATSAEKSLLRVAPGNFNAFDFAPYVAELAEFNRLFNPAVFDGGNLRYAQFNAQNQQGTPAGDAGQQNHFETLRAVYRDGMNFAAESLSDSTFIVDQGALAVFTAAFFPKVERDISGDGFAYTQYRTPILGINQAFGRPIEADTTYVLKKEQIVPSSPECALYHVWEMRLWHLEALNPLLSANDGVTGVLRLKKDATLNQKGTAMQRPL